MGGHINIQELKREEFILISKEVSEELLGH